MNLLNKYFAGLTFFYLEEKQGYALYGAAIHSMIGGDNQRYVLAFVPAHLGIQRSAPLVELPWKNLQTRICPKIAYRLKPQVWKFPYQLQNASLEVKDRGKAYATYASDEGLDAFPFEVLLINNPKKRSIYQFPNKVNLHWAIDQFNTVFNYVGNVQPMHMTTLQPLPSQNLDSIPTPPLAQNPLAGWFSGTQIHGNDTSAARIGPGNSRGITDSNFELI